MSSDEKITIRTARESDAPALLAIYAPYVENTAITLGLLLTAEIFMFSRL